MPIVLIFVGVAAAGVLLFVHEKKATAPLQPAPLVQITGAASSTAVTTAQQEQTAVQTASSAIPLVGGAVSAVEGIILGAHVARLKGATAENQTIPNVVNAFDQDFAQIADAYNAGQVTAAQAIAALQQIDQTIFATMHGTVGAPGTAWQSKTTSQIGTGINPSYTAPCDKTCTASCCVYLNDIRPAIYGRNVATTGGYQPFQIAPNIVGGAIQALQNGSGVVYVIPVSAPANAAYGKFSRPTYMVTFTKPAATPLSIAHLI